VFVHLLPELARRQDVLGKALRSQLTFLENHVYLIALLGLAAFYGVERASVQGQRGNAQAAESQAADAGGSSAGMGAFWLNMGSFAVYNVLVGYLLLHNFGAALAVNGSELSRAGGNMRGLVLFAIAMLLHFVANDYGLRLRHGAAYEHTGRWILAAAIFVGWGLGVAVEVREAVIAALTAFLAGGVILNVLKEELPAERASRFWPFAVGAAAYSALLIAL
jgi:hypothetical protein